jgi:uncharacterized protein YlxW (UPF0749 family)
VLILVGLGFLLAVAYHQTRAAEPESSKVHAGLVTDVKNRQAETDAMQRQADRLRDQVSQERDNALGSDTGAMRTLEENAGVSKVRGAGATVKLADAPQPVDPVTGKATGTNLGKVQDRDLQAVVNELWHEGAEAVAINGERLTATSTIRTAGETILVDFKPIMSPYQVDAIGPGDLDKRFSSSGTGALFRSLASDYHMSVQVRHQGDLTLPAAPDPQLHYAKPVPSATPSHSATPGHAGSPSPSRSGGR